MSKKVEIEVGGKKLAVSNLEKVLYPKVGFTKGQLIDYYIRISPPWAGAVDGFPVAPEPRKVLPFCFSAGLSVILLRA